MARGRRPMSRAERDALRHMLCDGMRRIDLIHATGRSPGTFTRLAGSAAGASSSGRERSASALLPVDAGNLPAIRALHGAGGRSFKAALGAAPEGGGEGGIDRHGATLAPAAAAVSGKFRGQLP